jgi:hypothetical protein
LELPVKARATTREATDVRAQTIATTGFNGAALN